MKLLFEVVRVLDECSLVNAKSYQCGYQTGDTESLTPGYYVVVWDTPSGALGYDETAQFFGPFHTRSEANGFAHRATDQPSDARRVLH